MTAYNKIAGTWTPAKQLYLRRNGVFTPAKKVFVKRSGVWTEAFENDTTPSSPPEISMEVRNQRYFRIGVRLPGSNDPDLAMIRVLVGRDAMPTTQFGSGYVYTPDANFPNENWSDWYYNGHNPAGSTYGHGNDTTIWDYKQYPPNPTDSTNLPGGKYYYFAAWSLDNAGNWSAGVFSRIYMPKDGTQAAPVIVKEANFQANYAGSAGLNGAGYTEGDLVVRESPRSDGFWFYGNQISVAVPAGATITNSRIRVSRAAEDGGQPTANVRLFWHTAESPSQMPVTDANMKDVTLLGTINKGESKWFDLPSSYNSHYNVDLKGMGLVYGIQASDQLTAKSLEADIRCGEVNLVWQEPS